MTEGILLPLSAVRSPKTWGTAEAALEVLGRMSVLYGERVYVLGWAVNFRSALGLYANHLSPKLREHIHVFRGQDT